MGLPLDEPGTMDYYLYMFAVTPDEWHEVTVQAASREQALALARGTVPAHAVLLYSNTGTMPIEPRILGHEVSRPYPDARRPVTQEGSVNGVTA